LILGVALCFVLSVSAGRPTCGYFGPATRLNGGTTTQVEAPLGAVSVTSFHNSISPWTIGCTPSWASCVDQLFPDEASTSYYTFDQKTNLLATSKENSSYKDFEQSYQWESADNLLEGILLGGTISQFNNSATISTEHDDQNRLTKESFSTASFSYDLLLSYESDSHPMLATKLVVNVSGTTTESTFSYQFNSDGLITSLILTTTQGYNQTEQFYYDDNKNLIAELDSGNLIWTNYSYSSNGQIESIANSDANLTITYNDDQQLDSIVENVNDDVFTCTFHYSSAPAKVGKINKPAQKKRAAFFNFFNPLQRIKHIIHHMGTH